jgi:glutathione synthase/RimK-type ligase-like ATP-grasp enzyme
MNNPSIDITLLTEKRYLRPIPGNPYLENIFLEDQLLTRALESRGLKVHRTRWDDPEMDWSETKFAVFRTTWDYFDRFAEFDRWLTETAALTQFLNPLELIRWNAEKHYLKDLQQKGIPIPPTYFILRGSSGSLAEHVQKMPWDELILKPVVSGTARHTYRFERGQSETLEAVFKELVAEEDMMLQAFQRSILTEGEVTFVVFGGKFSHAVRKVAKPGDFRVQDDFGGTIHAFEPTGEQIAFAELAVGCCPQVPVYARVDAMWHEDGSLMVSELEIIEPELWMRFHPPSAEVFADAIGQGMNRLESGK